MLTQIDISSAKNGKPSQRTVHNNSCGHPTSVLLVLTCLIASAFALSNAAIAQSVEILLQARMNAYSAAISPNGRLVAMGSDKTTLLWDVESGRLIRQLGEHVEPAISVTFSNDSKRLLIATSGAVRLWDVVSSHELNAIYPTDGERFYSATFASDETKILLHTSRRIAIWELDSGRELRSLFAYSRLESVEVSTNGKYILASGEKRVWLLDASSGGLIKEFSGIQSSASGIAFSPDGSLAATGHDDGVVKLWDIPSGTEKRRYTGHTKGVRSVAFTPNGKAIVSAGADRLTRVWDVSSDKELRRFEGSFARVSPDGQSILTIVYSGGERTTAGLWDISTGRQLKQFASRDRAISSLAFSPDGKKLLAGDSDHATLWDLASGRLFSSFEGHNAGVTAVAFSPDGKTALTGGKDDFVRLWNISSREELRRFGPVERLCYVFCAVDYVTFSSNAKRAFAYTKGHLARLWDVESGRELRYFRADDAAHTDFKADLAPSGDAVLIVADDEVALARIRGTTFDPPTIGNIARCTH